MDPVEEFEKFMQRLRVREMQGRSASMLRKENKPRLDDPVRVGKGEACRTTRKIEANEDLGHPVDARDYLK